MVPATVWHFLMSVFAQLGVAWLKAREWVREYPGLFLIALIVVAAVGVWL
jgi:hypothetical protein